MTDSISDVLFVTERSAVKNLRRRYSAREIDLVGNVMIDSLLAHRTQAERSDILRVFGLEATDGTIVPYYGVTLHRAETVDDRVVRGVLEALAHSPVRGGSCSRSTPASANASGATARFRGYPDHRSAGVPEFMKLMSTPRCPTDSGGSGGIDDLPGSLRHHPRFDGAACHGDQRHEYARRDFAEGDPATLPGAVPPAPGACPRRSAALGWPCCDPHRIHPVGVGVMNP